MLHKYECEKCGGVCYIESEVWESCPICEETPEERKLRERAEQVERERDELRKALETLLDDVEKEGSHEIPSGTLNEARRVLGGE